MAFDSFLNWLSPTAINGSFVRFCMCFSLPLKFEFFFSFRKEYSVFCFSCNSTKKFDLYALLKVIQEEKNVQNKAKNRSEVKKGKLEQKSKSNKTQRGSISWRTKAVREKKTRPKPHKKINSNIVNGSNAKKFRLIGSVCGRSDEENCCYDTKHESAK